MKKQIKFGVLGILLMIFTFSLKVDAMSIDNQEFSFKTIDNRTVTTRNVTPNNVTMLIFGKTDCGYTSRTLQDIVNSDWVKSSDVRIVFADVDGASKAEVTEFAKQYNCNDIDWCYGIVEDMFDPIPETVKAKYYYRNMLDPMPEEIPFPIIALVDSSNKVRSVTVGPKSETFLLEEMQKFTTISNYVKTKFDITVPGIEEYAYTQTILALVNQARAKQSLPKLTLDVELTEAAMQRAAEIAVFYSFTRPDGSSCFSVNTRGLIQGENITIANETPEDAMKGWMDTADSYANIMDEDKKIVTVDKKGKIKAKKMSGMIVIMMDIIFLKR